MAQAERQNLAGVRVLDITQYIAGPTLGRILADLGAEVVKLEMPPAGEYSRRGSFPPRVEGQSPAYIYYNRGKRSMCIDFKRPEGAAIVTGVAPLSTPSTLTRAPSGFDNILRDPHEVCSLAFRSWRSPAPSIVRLVM